jgi:hypothetical protein
MRINIKEGVVFKSFDQGSLTKIVDSARSSLFHNMDSANFKIFPKSEADEAEVSSESKVKHPKEFPSSEKDINGVSRSQQFNSRITH